MVKIARLASKLCLVVGLGIVFALQSGCKDDLPERPEAPLEDIDYLGQEDDPEEELMEGPINLSNWKVTLPIPRPDGNPLEVEPPAILDYSTNETLMPFMFDDPADTSLVFYTYPGVTTLNSTYSRTELREQMVPGSNSVNWTFAEGGVMRGTLSVPEITLDDDGDTHRTMIMQIHGRLTNEQRDLIGEDDNNAPPVLKIYWQDDMIYVRTKQLENLDATYEEMLTTDAWDDDDGRFFERVVGTEKFTLEVIAAEGFMSVTLDDEETFVYDDIHMEKWGVFENYFKAGNYLVTTDEHAHATVKYYELEVTHD